MSTTIGGLMLTPNMRPDVVTGIVLLVNGFTFTKV